MDLAVILGAVDENVSLYLQYGGDRERFLEQVRPLIAKQTGSLSEADAAPLLEAGLEYANCRALELPSRAPAPTSESGRVAALCAHTRDILSGNQAIREITESWPSVIAHELDRLLDDLAPRDGFPASPEAALFQLRDVCDTLTKFPTLVLARALVTFGDAQQAGLARRMLLREGLFGGLWLEAARTLAKAVCESAGPELARFNGIARMMSPGRGGLSPALESFVRIRNSEIGHGARRSASMETAVIVRQLLVGDLKAADHAGFRAGRDVFADVAPLLGGLRAAVACRPWDGLDLEAGEEEAIPLAGAGAHRRWRSTPGNAPDGHQDAPLDVFLRIAGAPGEAAGRLALGPFVRARVCRSCDNRDVFLFDSLHGASGDGRFDLIDYARGHKNRVRGQEAPDLGAWLKEEGAPASQKTLNEVSVASRAVVAMLDDARMDRRYMSPDYLRKMLREFLGTHPSGVFWLQAPAHTGKSTFLQGLASEELKDPFRTKGEEEAPLTIVAFFFKREYREGAATFLNGLGQAIQAGFGVREDAAAVLPSARDVLAAPRKERRQTFLRWLEEWRALRRRQFGDRAARLLVAIDGLDEADAPRPDNGADGVEDERARAEANRNESPLLFLPNAADLPEGLHLLLTSRRLGDAESPDWLAGALEPVAATQTRRLGLDDPGYRKLLADYVKERWEDGGDPAVATRVLRAAAADPDRPETGALFTTVSLLVEQLRRGELTLERLESTAEPEAAQEAYLQNLTQLGEKRADLAWQALVAIASEERAHDWQHGAGAIEDRATGGVLSAEGAEWRGVEFAHLLRLLAMDHPDGGPDARLVEALIALTSALTVSRAAAGAPRYRFGLKDFGRAIATRPEGERALRLAHARAATLLLDASETLAAPQQEKPDPADARARAAAEETLRAGLFRLRGHASQVRSETVAKRLQTLGQAIVGQMHELAEAASTGSDLRTSVAWHTALADLLEGTELGIEETIRRNDLAGAYLNRGIAKLASAAHGADAAIKDYDEAIRLMEALRADLGTAWTKDPKLRKDLALAYSNRGVAKMTSAAHGAVAAIDDFNKTIILQKSLRIDLGQDWDQSLDIRNDLATTYINRGAAKVNSAAHGADAAITDYDAAIMLQKALRDDLGQAWCQRPDLRNVLAMAYSNRGNAKQASAVHGADAAITDYNAAIQMMEDLREDLGQAWSQNPALLNDLASAYSNRGGAKAASVAHGVDAVIEDYDEAIRLREGLRNDLGQAWLQNPALRNDLASAYNNRGGARASSAAHGTDAAIKDFDAAIKLREDLRNELGQVWLQNLALRNDLALAYYNRGNAKVSSAAHGADAAIRDFDAAIKLQEDLRNELGQVWLQNLALVAGLRSSYQSRAVARHQTGDTEGARKDQNAATALSLPFMSSIIMPSASAWPPR